MSLPWNEIIAKSSHLVLFLFQFILDEQNECVQKDSIKITRILYLCIQKFIREHSQLSSVDVFGGFEIPNLFRLKQFSLQYDKREEHGRLLVPQLSSVLSVVVSVMSEARLRDHPHAVFVVSIHCSLEYTKVLHRYQYNRPSKLTIHTTFFRGEKLLFPNSQFLRGILRDE